MLYVSKNVVLVVTRKRVKTSRGCDKSTVLQILIVKKYLITLVSTTRGRVGMLGMLGMYMYV